MGEKHDYRFLAELVSDYPEVKDELIGFAAELWSDDDEEDYEVSQETSLKLTYEIKPGSMW